MAYETAFPVGEGAARDGMTLRDYFAAAAMTGMLARADFTLFYCEDLSSDQAARNAYEIADAMIRIREAK